MKYLGVVLQPLILLWVVSCAHAQSADTLGREIQSYKVPAQFYMFDKIHPERFYFEDKGFGMRLGAIFGVPDMDCFLANHAKDDLEISYTLFERLRADGSAERLNRATRIVSLKTGDDTRTWQEKELKDSTLQARHHQVLEKIRKEM